MNKEYKTIIWLAALSVATMIVAAVASLNPKFKIIATNLVIGAHAIFTGLIFYYLFYFLSTIFEKKSNKIDNTNIQTNFEHTHTHNHYHYNKTKLKEGAEQIESRPDGTTITTRYARRWD